MSEGNIKVTIDMEVKEYIREDGSNPYKKWFNRLDAVAAAKVAVATLRLEMGNTFKHQMDWRHW